MLAVLFSAVILLTGHFYLQHQSPTSARNFSAIGSRQAGVQDGLDIKLISERNPYIRSER